MNDSEEITRLFLFRHGHTEGGDDKRYKGHIDVELSEIGKRQLKTISGKLKNMNHDLKAVYTSDLKRALRSAEILSAYFGLEPVVLPELRERSFGRWEGMSFDEISREYPEEFEFWKADPLRYSPPGGESTLEVSERAVSVLNDLLKRHSGERFAIVSHGGVNRVMLCHLMGLPLNNIFRIEQDYGCINIVDIHNDGFPVIKLLNGSPYNLYLA